MIQKLSERISKRMVLNHTISKEDEELYEYGLYQGIVIVFNWITALCIGIFMNMIWQSIIFLIFFIPVRTYSGGIHANSPRICYIFSTLIQAGALFVLKYVSFSFWISISILIITGLLLILLSPVEAVNKPLDSGEIKKYKSISIRNWVIELLFFFIFYILNLKQVTDCILMSFILVSLLLFLGAITNRIRAIKSLS